MESQLFHFNLYNISKYRTQIMGVATLLIVICHAPLYDVEMHDSIRFLVGFGNVGVDVFLFLSGVGCYYSLKYGEGDKNWCKWYRKRYFRILVPYILMQVPYWTYYICINRFNLLDAIYEFSTLAFWVRHTGMWYIALLIPLYFLTPYLYRIICLNDSHRYKLSVVIIIAILLICNIKFNFGNVIINSIFDNVQIAFSRVPSYIVGMAIAKDVNERKTANWLVIIFISILLFIVFRIIGVAYHWCLFPIIILGSSCIFLTISKNNIVYGFVTLMGVLSLEMYLSNGYIRYIFMDSLIYTNDSPLFHGHYFDYFLIFLISLLLSLLVNILSKGIFNLMGLKLNQLSK